jgi:hypothetical protein
MMADLSLLLIKCPLSWTQIEEEVIELVRDKGFVILGRKGIDDLIQLMPKIYSDDNDNPEEYLERDIKSRIKLYGEHQDAIVYLLNHPNGNTPKKIDNLVGPTSFEEYEKPEYKDTLRAKFLGPKVIEDLENGREKEVRIDAFHCCRTKKEFSKEVKLYFDEETLRKYGIE